MLRSKPRSRSKHVRFALLAWHWKADESTDLKWSSAERSVSKLKPIAHTSAIFPKEKLRFGEGEDICRPTMTSQHKPSDLTLVAWNIAVCWEPQLIELQASPSTLSEIFPCNGLAPSCIS